MPARERAWTAAARFDAVLSSAVMDEAAKSAWCRADGLFPLQLGARRQSATQALAEPAEVRRRSRQPDADQAGQAAHQGARARVVAYGPRTGRDGGLAGAVKKTGLVFARNIVAAHAGGARLRPACETAGIDIRTLQRWGAQEGLGRGRWPAPDRAPGTCAPLDAGRACRGDAGRQRAVLCRRATGAHRVCVRQ